MVEITALNAIYKIVIVIHQYLYILGLRPYKFPYTMAS